MLQVYHPNAVTNIHIRRQIKITYALNELEENLVVSIRKTTWLSLDEVWEMLYVYNPQITRSSVYRTFCRNYVNKLPEHKKQNAKKFKEYEPGYLHIDVTYLPKFEGNSSYLFVAIDRATRCLFYQLYDAKNSENAEDFLYKCLDFFPFKIIHVLTDNGLEFTNRLIKSKKGMLCQKPSKLDEACIANNIEHRLTQPNSPKTNGMVERANGIIKKATILKEHYANKKEMNDDLMVF